jgi:hypothetical protein
LSDSRYAFTRSIRTPISFSFSSIDS